MSESKIIKLSHNKQTIVDIDDYEYLCEYKWKYSLSDGYAKRIVELEPVNGKRVRKAIWMHRVIAKTPLGLLTDHINGNGLDNRKSNLRVVTNQQNQWNGNGRCDRASKYKGVSLNKALNKWFATIVVSQKKINLGVKQSEELAALAYNDAAIKYFGEYARLNIID